MSKPQIGLIGCFQNGKSTFVNCLLENRVAITGEGVAKTKRIARYVYGEQAGFYGISPNGQRKKISKTEVAAMLQDSSRDGDICEITLPSPLLKKVDIVDTPGFDAGQEDTSITQNYIPRLDFIFFVIGRGSGGGGLNEAEKEVLAQIVRVNKPFSVLFNCRDFLHWNPQESNVKQCIRALAATFQQNEICPYAITSEDFILPVNLAWYWQAIVKQGIDEQFSFFAPTSAEVNLLKKVKNHFYDDYQGLPSVEQLISLSNIDWVKRYITAPQNVIGILTDAILAPNLRCSVDGTTVHAAWNCENPTYDYELSYRRPQEEAWTTRNMKHCEADIPNLEEGQTYEFRIRAIANHKRSISEYSPVVRVEIPKKKTVVTWTHKKQKGMMDDL